MNPKEIEAYFEDENITLPADEAAWVAAIAESERLFTEQELAEVPETKIHALLIILREYAPWIAAAVSPLVLAGLYLFFRKKDKKN